MAIAVVSFSVLTGWAQQWSFNAQEVADYAAFFKQPSAVEGKCNAEVMGIDINRNGFSWDDMNTWLNAEGKIWLSHSATYAETVFGVCVKMDAPFNGRTSSLTWTTNADDNKWYPTIAGVTSLKGKFKLMDCKATVIHISNTKLDTVKIQMTNTDNDCYLHIRRNPNVKQIDISDSNGKCRQLAGYSNALSDKTAFLANNVRTTEFLDWLLNLENNHFSYSNLPVHPATGAVLTSGYKSQYNNVGGMPVGYINANGEYEIEVDEDIDLSEEYDIMGKMTKYTWKNEDGDVISLPSFTNDGWFNFDESCVNKFYRCEMTNETYPQLLLNTVWVKVVKATPSGINKAEESTVKIGPNPVSDILYITAEDVLNVNVFDKEGICVKSASSNVSTINVSDLATGIYYVKVKTTKEEKTVKVVKL